MIIICGAFCLSMVIVEILFFFYNMVCKRSQSGKTKSLISDLNAARGGWEGQCNMKRHIDLNSDIGEGFGSYTCGLDDEIIRYITSANLACGWHAGDPMIMQKTALQCAKNGVQIGAHPGFPDLLGFGRRTLAVTPAEARAYTLYQIGALQGMVSGIAREFLRSQGFDDDFGKGGEGGLSSVAGVNPAVRHIKLHGAFYNIAAKDEAIADAVIDAVASFDETCIIVTLSGSYMAKAARRRGLKVAEEVFADRGYQPDGTLVPRHLPGAFVHDKETAIRRVVSMARDGKVRADDGREIEIAADTICVHGDNPEAVAFVREIREALESEGLVVTAMDRFIK